MFTEERFGTKTYKSGNLKKKKNIITDINS